MLPGTRLGPYRLDRELGSGGMGRVWRATVEAGAADLEPGAAVAVKVVHPHLLESADYVTRFLREGRIGRAIRHRNVVRTYDCGAAELDGVRHHFLAMEYVEGQTLRDLLLELERVPEALCRHVGREIAHGLAAIREAGAVHRDVKPENVLITPDHVVKIMDLGVARLLDDTLRLSRSGTFVGSLRYAAPEYFQSDLGEPDHRADLHAVGLVLYELATGIAPYAAPDLHGTIQRVLTETPRRLGELNPQLSAFFEEVVHTLLAKDPAARFQTPEALSAAFGEGEAGTWWHARALALRSATRRPLRRVRIPRETAVFGREAELEKLAAAYGRAKAGEGRVVLLEGEAGIGKSRLVDELVGRLQQDGEDLAFLFGSYPPGGAATAAGAFSSAYREHFGEAGSAAWLAASPALVPAFDALLRGEPTPEGKEPLTKDSLQTCFVNATRALAAERPVIVFLDDLHFAPDEGRALFASLAMAVPGHRVLLIGSTRPGLDEAWSASVLRPEHADLVELRRLGPKDLMLLLRDTLGSDHLVAQLGGRIALKSDGNPFFAFEIVRGLREGQFITRTDEGTWVSTGALEAIQIPSSLLDLVGARVATLDPDDRSLLDLAACCGYDFDPALLAEALGVGRIPLLKQLAQIERAHRLVRGTGRRFAFDHHQVQEALYASLPEMLREEYHAVLGEALERQSGAADADPATLDGSLCVSLCEHFLKGARGAAALRYLEAAQRHLHRSYLPVEAAALDQAALAAPGLLTGASRVEVLLRVAHTLDGAGRPAAHRAAVDEAVALADDLGDAGLRAKAHRARGHFLERARIFEEAKEELELGLALAVETGDRKTESIALNCLGVLHAEAGLSREAHARFEQVLALHREAGSERGEASVVGNLGNTHRALGRLPEARACIERHLELTRKLGDRRGATTALFNRALVASMEGEREAAMATFEHYISESREIGYRRGEILGLHGLGHAQLAHGRLGEALVNLERCEALARECGSHHEEAVARGEVGAALLGMGRLDEAKAKLEQTLEVFRRQGNPGAMFTTHQRLGELAMEAGDDEGAEAHFDAAFEIAERIRRSDQATWTHLARGDLARARGDLDGARAHYTRAQETGVGGQVLLARIRLSALGEGDGDDVEGVRGEFEEVRDQMEPAERRLAHWLLFQRTGDLRDLEAANALLEEALAAIPQAHRATMRDHIRLHREIHAAWTSARDPEHP